EIAGKVSLKETNQGYDVTITPVHDKTGAKTYLVPLTLILKVKANQLVGVGEQLASGALNIKTLLQNHDLSLNLLSN
ncbi:hypothetical protein KJ809_01845, partial [Patescibacteria group bacterium]|nr:hypothetical protein [Patescibacteria group bacterium]